MDQAHSHNPTAHGVGLWQETFDPSSGLRELSSARAFLGLPLPWIGFRSVKRSMPCAASAMRRCWSISRKCGEVSIKNQPRFKHLPGLKAMERSHIKLR